MLPNGEKIAVPVHSVTGSFTDRRMEVSCTVIKDGGDDPDVTNGLPIVATVSIDISEKSCTPEVSGNRLYKSTADRVSVPSPYPDWDWK